MAETEAGVTPWWRWHLESDDIDEPAQPLPAWGQGCVQLEAGRFHGAMDGVQIDRDWAVFRMSSNRRLHQVFDTPQSTWALALLAPASDGLLFQHRETGGGDVLILPPGLTFDVVTLGRLEVTVVTLDLRRLPPGLERRPQDGAAILPGSVVTARLAESMRKVLAFEEIEGVSPSLRQRQLQSCLACDAVECLSRQGLGSDVRAAGSRVVLIDAARRLLLAETLTQGQVLPVSELAHRLGVSVRQLHKLFQERLGVSPRVYAERLRLSRARSDLRQCATGTTTVAAIASKWGFGHFGRFASSYRAAFGELPSDTARA